MDDSEPAPPSLLKGDDQMLTALYEGIGDILEQGETVPEPRRTDVFITTTLLSPEVGRYTDDYGTQIGDTDHHALFHFDDQCKKPSHKGVGCEVCRASEKFMEAAPMTDSEAAEVQSQTEPIADGDAYMG